MEEFFNLLEEIAHRSEFKRSENTVHSMPEQKSVERPVDRHAQRAQRAQQQLGRPRSTGLVDLLAYIMFLLESFDRPVDRRKKSVNRSDRLTGEYASPVRIRLHS